jgi:hypothetical protein
VNSSDDREPIETARRREQVAQLYIEGATVSQTAQRLGVSMKTVERELKCIAKIWRKILERDFATAKAQELAKINRLEAAAWEAWERSLQDEQSTKVIVEGGKKKAEKVTRKQPGDARFLDKVAWCIDKRCQILALAQPIGAPGTDNADNLTLDQRRQRVLALLNALLERERTEAARPGLVDSAAGRPFDADSAASLG